MLETITISDFGEYGAIWNYQQPYPFIGGGSQDSESNSLARLVRACVVSRTRQQENFYSFESFSYAREPRALPRRGERREG